MNELDPKPDPDNRWFYTPRGPLPPEGLAAVKSLGDQFRLPAWLPEDLPKRLQLPLEGDNGDPRYGLAVGGHFIIVTARFPGWGYREFVGTTKIDAKPVDLGGVEGLEVQQGSEVSYYLSINNVGYWVFGPSIEKEILRKVAASLAPQDH